MIKQYYFVLLSSPFIALAVVASTLFLNISVVRSNPTCAEHYIKIGQYEVLASVVAGINGVFIPPQSDTKPSSHFRSLTFRLDRLCLSLTGQFEILKVPGIQQIGLYKDNVLIMDAKSRFGSDLDDLEVNEHGLREIKVGKRSYFFGGGENPPEIFGSDVTFDCGSKSDNWAGGIPPGSFCFMFYRINDELKMRFRFYDYYWPMAKWRDLAREMEQLLKILVRNINA